nr:hypothetical protein [Tanacetum cinerariifolium]
DVIENEVHFIMKVVNNDLSALTMVTKYFMSRVGGGFMVLGGRSFRESKNACGEVGGIKKISSIGSMFMVRDEECLEGCVGTYGGEFNKGRDDFRVRKGLLGKIPDVVIGKRGGETFGDDGGAVWLSVGGDKAWYGGDDGRGLLKHANLSGTFKVTLMLFSLFDLGIVYFG